MKKFVILCKDKITGMEMILSECSYNQACSYLENQYPGECLGCENVGNLTKIKFAERNFFYDEERGYLLGQ